MAIILKPNTYLQGMLWQIKPKTKIDTVNMSPMRNSVRTEIVDTHELTSGETPSGTAITLPLADNNGAASAIRIMTCNRSSATWFAVMGFACTSLTTIKGSYQVHFDTPPARTPTATWSIEGDTQYLTRGAKTVDEIANSVYDSAACTFIEDNKAGEEAFVNSKSYDNVNRSEFEEGLLMDYAQSSIVMYPWIRKTTGEWPGGMIGEYLTSLYRPKEADIFCEWNNGSDADWLPPYENWNTYNLSGKIRQGPYTWYAATGSEPVQNHFIPMIPSWTYSFYCRVTKINSYDYQVDYELPVRYFQVAAAKAVGSWIHSVEIRRDSYGWKDVASKVTITLQAGTFDESTEQLSYSLDGSGNLTENVINAHPISIEQNDLVTMDALWGSDTWVERMPEYLLTEYQKGKYVLECTVKADWALINNIRINTEIQVKLQNGQFISENGSTTTFAVKTIEKSFKNSEFVYNLRMLEV